MSRIRPPRLEAILFDLDGTLLQVQMHRFVPLYLRGLSRHFEGVCDSGRFCREVLSAIRLVLQDEVERSSNEALFFAQLETRLGIDGFRFSAGLTEYCGNGMADLAAAVRPLPLARRALEQAFGLGFKVALATNPVFPRAIIDARLAWAGIDDLPFDHVTSYENSRACKPSPLYFRDLCRELDVPQEACLMVGNDTQHDLCASALGMKTYLMDPWQIRRPGPAYPCHYRGGFAELMQLMASLEQLT